MRAPVLLLASLVLAAGLGGVAAKKCSKEDYACTSSG